MIHAKISYIIDEYDTFIDSDILYESMNVSYSSIMDD